MKRAYGVLRVEVSGVCPGGGSYCYGEGDDCCAVQQSPHVLPQDVLVVAALQGEKEPAPAEVPGVAGDHPAHGGVVGGLQDAAPVLQIGRAHV